MIRFDHAGEIAEAYDLGSDVQLSGPVARGEVGQIWQLTTPTGSFAVKEPFEAPIADETDDEATFQDLSIAAGVPAPRIVRRPNGTVHLDVENSRIRVYEWLELCPPDRELEPSSVGAVVAALHRVDYFGSNRLDPWYTEPIGGTAWKALCLELTVSRAPFADRFIERCNELIALEGLLEPPSDLQTCHRDLFADNVLATPLGELCVIDFENSGHADPSQELAVVLFEFAGTDPVRAKALYGAYRDGGGPGTVERPGAFAMAIAQLGHIGHLSATRWLADPDPSARSRNKSRVDEFLEDGITHDHIEAILDAVTHIG